MKDDQTKAYAVVLVQIASIIVILATGRPFAYDYRLLTIELAGIALGVWAVVTMGWHNMNVSPLVRRYARLVTKGPYAMIRHPMYLSLLLTICPLVADQYSHLRLTAASILAVDLIIKIQFEEGLLKQHFAGYQEYMSTTKRLIPFVF